MKRDFSVYRKMVSVMIAFVVIFAVSFSALPVSATGENPTYIIASSDSSGEYQNQAQYVCTNGTLPSALKNAITAGNATFRFAAGSYLIEGLSIQIGSNSVFEGISEISQPLDVREMIYPDSTSMAVFETRTHKLSTEEAGSIKGSIETKNVATNVSISNIALSGHVIIKLNSLKNSQIRSVLVHNYRGIYPDGAWCNMGYGGATASFWLYGSCEDIIVDKCQVQCSSHHGFAIHSGSSTIWAKNINVIGMRALYCGNGQLRGTTTTEINDSIAKIPETEGHGYLDWSVAFDLCENQAVENVSVADSYALEGWKCGFYTEPEDTGGPINNIAFYRCRSDRAGQRNVVPGTDRQYTISRETENSNFFTQGGYYEDCISVDGEKCGWLAFGLRTTANSVGTGRLQLVRCGDMGSPISFVFETLKDVMYESRDVNCDGFWSLNATKAAMWIYGTDALNFTNTLILCPDGQNTPPVLIGYEERQQLKNSRWSSNDNAVFRFSLLRKDIIDSQFKGSVYNLGTGVKTAEIKSGSTFNGKGYNQETEVGSNINIVRKTGTVNVANFVNDDWGKPVYTVTFNSNSGTAVASKNAVIENTITAPTPPKRTAYTFMGWYTAKTGGTKVAFPYKVYGPATLYARWKVAKPTAPTKVTAKRIAKRTIRIKWASVTKVAGYSIYRAVKATGTYKRIANTKYLTYTNKKLIAGKYYYYKVRAYRMSGKTKVYGNMSKRIRARA